LQSPRAKDDPARLQNLLQERLRLKRALMDPGLADPDPGNTDSSDRKRPA